MSIHKVLNPALAGRWLVEQEIRPRPKEERSSSNAWAKTSRSQMCPVADTSQGMDGSLNSGADGIKSPAPSSPVIVAVARWGGKNVNNGER